MTRHAPPNPDTVPPEVLAAFGRLPAGGGWEAGTADRHGRQWVHQPWQGWRPANPQPYPTPGRVYTSRAVARAARRERAARWAAGPTLVVAVTLLCVGASRLSLALAAAGLACAAGPAVLLWWDTRARPR